MYKHSNIALTEDLSKYAQGETFWKAMLHLCETLREWLPSPGNQESDISNRIKMYSETGINKVEIFISKEGDRFAVRCSNTWSSIQAESEHEALMKYLETKAQTSKINTGNVSGT